MTRTGPPDPGPPKVNRLQQLSLALGLVAAGHAGLELLLFSRRLGDLGGPPNPAQVYAALLEITGFCLPVDVLLGALAVVFGVWGSFRSKGRPGGAGVWVASCGVVLGALAPFLAVPALRLLAQGWHQ
jgi:hypothetical protein